MNRKHLLFATMGFSAIVMSAILINPIRGINPKHQLISSMASAEEKEEIAGARRYDKMIRANQITGEIDQADINQAIESIQANDKISNKKTRAFDLMTWQERGPNNVGGRTRALLSDKDNPTKLYMGGVNGGLFMSANSGGTWQKITGNDTSFGMSVASIAQTANGNIFYGTGEGFYLAGGEFGTGQLGTGVYKSSDGGATFQRLPSTIPGNINTATNWSYVNKLVAHPTEPDRIFAAVSGGFFASSNGGTTWAKPTGLASTAMFLDADISSDGSRMLASTGTALYISNDGGTTFGTNIMGTNGLAPGSGLNRIEVAIAPSNKDFMYVVTVKSSSVLDAVFKTTDGGTTWTKILAGGSAFLASDVLGSQGYYDCALGVNPVNPELIYLGGQLNLYRYTPGTGPNDGWINIANWLGNSFQGKLVHADMHGIVFNKANPEEMYVICDGGFYRTTNASDVNPFFAEKNKNYITSQPYGMSANYLGHYIIGTQDQGSYYVGQEANSQLTSREINGGDGTRNWMSDLVPNVVFTSVVEGELRRATDGGQGFGSFNSIFDPNIDNLTAGSSSANNPDGAPDDGALWVSPLDVQERLEDTVAKSNLVFGTYKNIWLTQDALNNNPIWFKLTSIANNVFFSAVKIAGDGNTVYAGTSGGSIYRIKVPNLWTNNYKYADTITNTGITFPLKSQIEVKIIATYSGRFVTDIDCNNVGDKVVASFGNYGNTTYIYKSSNALDSIPTFSSIQGSLPSMPIYSVIMVGNNHQKIIAGTEFGVWGTNDGGSSPWIELNSMKNDSVDTWHPRSAVYEVIQKDKVYTDDAPGTNTAYSGSVIYTATHGRGVFRSTSLAPLTVTTPLGTGKALNKIQALDIYPNPTTNNIFVNYQTDKSANITVRIMSLTGTVMNTYSKNVNAGKNVLDFDVAHLAAGGYIISIVENGKKSATTFIKR